MKQSDIALFNDSLERCQRNHLFLDQFYARFLSSSQMVRDKFEGTDFGRQKQVLGLSLYMMAAAASGHASALQQLEPVARRHSRQSRDIGPELYNLWLEALLDTVRLNDPHYDPTVERAWCNVLQFGIDFLKSRY